MVDPRTPVLVGAGVAHQRSADPLEGAEAVSLMTTAVSAKAGLNNARRRSVVLPLPRKPVKIVAGMTSRVGAAAKGTVSMLGIMLIVSCLWAAGKTPWQRQSARVCAVQSVAFSVLPPHHPCHNAAA